MKETLNCSLSPALDMYVYGDVHHYLHEWTISCGGAMRNEFAKNNESGWLNIWEEMGLFTSTKQERCLTLMYASIHV